jgi:hypothetical protein
MILVQRASPSQAMSVIILLFPRLRLAHRWLSLLPPLRQLSALSIGLLLGSPRTMSALGFPFS